MASLDAPDLPSYQLETICKHLMCQIIRLTANCRRRPPTPTPTSTVTTTATSHHHHHHHHQHQAVPVSQCEPVKMSRCDEASNKSAGATVANATNDWRIAQQRICGEEDGAQWPVSDPVRRRRCDWNKSVSHCPATITSLTTTTKSNSTPASSTTRRSTGRSSSTTRTSRVSLIVSGLKRWSRPAVSWSRHHYHQATRSLSTTHPIMLTLLILCSFMLHSADSCSSRSTPKPRPPTPTTRPNITFQTYACPEAYAKWYCLNGATCFSVRIGESILYNCECADGYMGQRCEFKDLDGSYLPGREKILVETAGIAGGVTLAVLLVVAVLISYIYLRNHLRKSSTSPPLLSYASERDLSGYRELSSPSHHSHHSRFYSTLAPPVPGSNLTKSFGAHLNYGTYSAPCPACLLHQQIGAKSERILDLEHGHHH